MSQNQEHISVRYGLPVLIHLCSTRADAGYRPFGSCTTGWIHPHVAPNIDLHPRLSSKGEIEYAHFAEKTLCSAISPFESKSPRRNPCNVPSWAFMSAFPIFRTIAHCLHMLLSVACDLVRMFVLLSRSRRALSRGESLPPQTTGTVPRAQGETTAGRRFRALVDGHPESNVPAARFPGERQSGYAHPLASKRVPLVLAVEVQTLR